VEDSEDVEYSVDLDPRAVGRRFVSDELRFTGIDVGAARTRRRRTTNTYEGDSYDSGDSDEVEYIAGPSDEFGQDMQLILREKEEMLVEQALERMRRARELGKTNVKLTRAQIDALERAERRQRLAAPPAKAPKSKKGAQTRPKLLALEKLLCFHIPFCLTRRMALVAVLRCIPRKAITLHLPLYRATMLRLPLDLRLVLALGLPHPNRSDSSSLTRLRYLHISILTSILTSRDDTIQTRIHTKPVHHQLTQRHTHALILPTQIGSRVHARRPTSSRTRSIDMTLQRIPHRRQHLYVSIPTILDLPHHKLDELLLVLRICTHLILLYVASPRTR
jgi:hypothetical protein